jgi:ATP-dependent helicase/nuclease subunit A
VVWWDPALLTAKVDENFGLRQEEILAADVGDVEAGLGLEHYESWKEARRSLLQHGSRPSYEVLTVTGSELEEDPVDFSPEIAHVEVERPTQRPHGERFGTLVHTVLRDIDLDADSDAVSKLTQVHAQTLGATSEETSFAAEAVQGALTHPVLAAAREALSEGRCHREAPFVLRLDDGRMLEGEMDLTYRDADGWVVVDFKTDASVDSRRERYEAQLSWYVFALGRIKDQTCRGILMAV